MAQAYQFNNELVRFMKGVFMKLLSVLFTLFSFNLFAADPCSSDYGQKLNLRYQTGKFQDGNCFISIGNVKTYNLVYRSFLFTSEGQIMVFNSFGDGPSSTSTGARVFYLWPYKNKLNYEIFDDRIEINLVTGQKAIFNFDPGSWEDLDRARVFIDPVIEPQNQGGIEIESPSHILLDLGFRMGSTPSTDRKRMVNLFVRGNQSCRLSIKKFIKVRSGEPVLIPDTNKKLEKLIEKYCDS